jgi:hypothetical protein
MPDGQNVVSRWRGFRIWRLLAVASLFIGLGTLLREETRKTSGRGRHRSSPSAAAISSGYEPKDISARDVSIILGAMAATTALVIGIVFVTVWRFNINRNENLAKLTSQETAQIVPPSPHLQADPFADLARVQSREARLLSGYGWLNTNHTLARIPIDRAMTLSVGKSLDAAP